MKPQKQSRIILSDIKDFSALPKKFINSYHTHLICENGCISFLFKEKGMKCKAGEFLFWFAESKVKEIIFSKNFKARVLLVEKDYLLENIPDQGWGVNATLYSREHPVKTLKDEHERIKIISNFKTLYERYREFDHRFYEEALRLQMQIFVLEMWHIFANDYERRKHSLQSGSLYERFILLLQEHCIQHREVQFYAAQLHITAKYLNQICKNSSGTTASEWIQRYARERIVLLLQNKNLSIAQIADEMEFSSRSFFTRYVKKLLGVTPVEYQQRLSGL